MWLNSHYIKEMPGPPVGQEADPRLPGRPGDHRAGPDSLPGWCPPLSPRCKTLVEMAEAARFYFQDPRPYEAKAAQKFLTPATAHLMQEIAARLAQAFRSLGGGPDSVVHRPGPETGQKMVNLAQPVRVALTGKTASPGLYEIISILGREEALQRFDGPWSLRPGVGHHWAKMCPAVVGTAGLLVQILGRLVMAEQDQAYGRDRLTWFSWCLPA